MGVKISELSATNSIHAEDYLIINDYENNTTYKGTLDTIIGNFIKNESCIYDGSSGYTVSGYVSKYCESMGFITSDNFSSELTDGIENYLYNNDYITESYLSNNSYITESYLSENSYITESYLESISYINTSNLSGFLFGQSGYLNDIYNSDGTVNYAAIYQGISSYFET